MNSVCMFGLVLHVIIQPINNNAWLSASLHILYVLCQPLSLSSSVPTRWLAQGRVHPFHNLNSSHWDHVCAKTWSTGAWFYCWSVVLAVSGVPSLTLEPADKPSASGHARLIQIQAGLWFLLSTSKVEILLKVCHSLDHQFMLAILILLSSTCNEQC